MSGDEAWEKWIHDCPHLCNTDRCSFLAGFAAGQVAALTEAAELAGTFNDRGLVPHSFDVAHDLRARAVAVKGVDEG